jgi:hypothetical protein
MAEQVTADILSDKLRVRDLRASEVKSYPLIGTYGQLEE